MNTKTDAEISYADIATCQYPILGIDHTVIINLPIKTNPQTSGAAYDQMTAIMNSGASGHVKIGTELIGYHGMTWLNSMFYLDIEGLRAQGGTTSQDHYIGETVSIPTVTDYGVASYDAAKPKPAKYKYWVLRVPVSIPEHTV